MQKFWILLDKHGNPVRISSNGTGFFGSSCFKYSWDDTARNCDDNDRYLGPWEKVSGNYYGPVKFFSRDAAARAATKIAREHLEEIFIFECMATAGVPITITEI